MNVKPRRLMQALAATPSISAADVQTTPRFFTPARFAAAAPSTRASNRTTEPPRELRRIVHRRQHLRRAPRALRKPLRALIKHVVDTWSISVIHLEYRNSQNQLDLAKGAGDHPKTSVLDRWNRSHDIKNLFVVDAAGLVTCGRQNPTMTILALPLRTPEHPAGLIRQGAV
jgi:choline dehydrogenase-like flavoprotein